MLLPLLAGGCLSEELYGELDELEANEMTAILQFNGIDAKKTNQGKGFFAVGIPSSDLPRSVELLHSWGYPREQSTSLGDLFKPEGIVPTKMEEQIRFLYGVAQELTETLGYLNGVIDSRVHIALGNIAGNTISGLEKDEKNSASVFLLYDDRQGLLGTLIPKIKQIVGNSMPNLSADNVVVLAQPAVEFEDGGTYVQGKDAPFKIGSLEFRRNELGYVGGLFAALLLLNIGLFAVFVMVLLRNRKTA